MCARRPWQPRPRRSSLTEAASPVRPPLPTSTHPVLIFAKLSPRNRCPHRHLLRLRHCLPPRLTEDRTRGRKERSRRLLRRLETPRRLRWCRRKIFGGAWVVTAVVGNSGVASVVAAALFLAAVVLVRRPREVGKQRPPWPTPASAATAGGPQRRARSGLEPGTGTGAR